jgi:hypothetical protein
MHTRRTLPLISALILSSSVAFAQSDVPPAAPEAPVDQAPPVEVPPPPPPPPAPMAPAPVPPAAVPMSASIAASTAIAPSQSSFKIETPNGSSIKIGLLLQPQFQMAGTNNAETGYAYNLYIRRTRVLVGGTLFGAIDYFFETDYPNLFLAGNNYNAEMGAAVFTKATPGLNIQDAFATAHPFGDLVKLDVGYMLPPLAHNAVQGAGTLYSWDYFTNSFNSTAGTVLGSTASPVGRDTGAQLRGLVLDGHLEYRVGLFQGFRHPAANGDVAGNNFFRAAGRLQINLLDPETGFFYAGTYLGAKRVLSLGGSFDIQGSYHYYAGDIFADLPAGPGVFTAQVNFVYMNGGADIPGLVKQKAVMGEIGYNIAGARVSPILRAEKLWNDTTDPGRYSGGVGWWPYGHNSNLKLFFTQQRTTGETRALNQVNLQWQVYFF